MTMINYGRVNKDSEFIRQVHTTLEMDTFAKDLKKQSLIDNKLSILTLNAPTWPLAWYF